jgi:hypothetical protein
LTVPSFSGENTSAAETVNAHDHKAVNNKAPAADLAIGRRVRYAKNMGESPACGSKGRVGLIGPVL